MANGYFKQTLEKAIANEDSVWKAIAYQNMATVLKQNEKYKEAINLLKKAMDLSNFDDEEIINDLLLLTDIYISTNQLKLAQQSIKRLESVYKKTGSPRSKVKYFLLKSKLLSNESNGELARVYIDSTFALKDSLNTVFNSEVILNAKQRIDYEKQKSILKQKEIQQSRKLWIRNGLIILLVLLLIIGSLLYNRYRLKVKGREQLILAKKEKAEASLHQFKKSIQEKNELILHFEKELETVTKEARSLTDSSKQVLNQEQEKKVIQQLQEAAILTDKDWREFSALFEKVHTRFFERLNQKYSVLTKAEIRLMTLSRMRLDNKEMALMLGVGTSAIRQSKSRLRKKISLPKDTSLEDLAQEI